MIFGNRNYVIRNYGVHFGYLSFFLGRKIGGMALIHGSEHNAGTAIRDRVLCNNRICIIGSDDGISADVGKVVFLNLNVGGIFIIVSNVGSHALL